MNLLLFSGCLTAILLVFGLCGEASAQTASLSEALTPEEVFRIAIYGPNFDGNAQEGSICGRLNQTQPPSSATQDLRDRCNDLAPTQQLEALRQIAGEEVSTEGTSSVETSNKHIGARLAALRGGAIGLNLHGLALDIGRQTLPATLVASLLPYAALSSTVPAITSNPFERFGIFASGNLSLGDKDLTSNESAYDFHTLGITAGVDYTYDDPIA